jgi:meiosis arrest female protein 1
MEVPGQRLPLFKFREMYENRFMTSVSVSDLYKMKDVCLISEEPNHRIISLNPEHRNTPSPLLQPSMPMSHLVSFFYSNIMYLIKYILDIFHCYITVNYYLG